MENQFWTPQSIASIIVAMIGFFGTLAGLYYKYGLNGEAIKDTKLKKGEKIKPVIEVEYLKNHKAPKKIDALIRRVEINFESEDKGKEALVSEILIRTLKIVRNNLTEIGEKVDNKFKVCQFKDRVEEIDCPNCNEMYILHMKYYKKIIDEYSTIYKDDRYTEDERKALEVGIKKFNKINYERIEELGYGITDLSYGKFSSNCIEITSPIFLHYYLTFSEITRKNSYKMLESINGELAGLTFKGKEIGGH